MKYLRNWIVEKISLNEFANQSDVVWFALTRGLVTTLVAVVFNFGVCQFLALFPIVEVTIAQNPLGDGIITALVAGPISLFAYYLIGTAIRDLSISRKDFERLSRTDPLTGLLNRRAFMTTIASSQAPYALAVFDIDRFKLINDTFGHGVGDEVLVHVAQTMEVFFNGLGPVARLGGEEFAVLLCETTKVEAMKAVNLYRQELASSPIAVAGATIAVTISAGISQCKNDRGHSILLTDADRALYLAKAAGRNRVVHADELGPIQDRYNLSPAIEMADAGIETTSTCIPYVGKAK